MGITVLEQQTMYSIQSACRSVHRIEEAVAEMSASIARMQATLAKMYDLFSVMSGAELDNKEEAGQ